MNTSFYNGILGITSSQTGIDITSNNISNVNTTAYKETRADFSTIFSTTLNESYMDSVFSEKGLGSTVDATTVNLSQGSLLATDNDFDIAIAGEGWFGVGGVGEVYYTRNGSFNKDSNGDLVNSQGYYLLGTSGDNITSVALSKDKLDNFGQIYDNGSLDSVQAYQISPIDDIDLSSVDSQKKINLPDLLYYPPVATTNVSFKANLDPTVKTKIDPDTDTEVEVPNTEHYSTSIISPTGEKNILDMTFTKEVPQQQNGTTWDASVAILEPSDIQYDPNETYDPTKYKVDENAKTIYNIIDQQDGTLSFNADGALISNTLGNLSNSGTELTLNLGTIYDPDTPNSGYDGLISIKDNNFSSLAKADGQVEGYLTKYSIDESGRIVANFTNGESVPVAKIGIYHFQNDQGLSSEGGSLYQESANSGKPIFYQDENGNYFNNSQIISHNLEQSNVNFSNALTELIVLQKTYDANAKSITTSDQMIQRAINMKT